MGLEPEEEEIDDLNLVANGGAEDDDNASGVSTSDKDSSEGYLEPLEQCSQRAGRPDRPRPELSIKAKSRDRRKRGIPALIYTQFGTSYTILGIANGLSGHQAGLPVGTTGSRETRWD
jgi:hypothetical protein